MTRSAGRFAAWLNASMQSRGLSQAALARALGIADAQVSRWRRGQAIPTVTSLQRLADALGVPRATLDRIAGYPVDDIALAADDPELLAELQAYQARLARVLERRVPRPLWPAYVEACEGLAEALAAALARLEARARDQAEPPRRPERSIGFHAEPPR